MANAVSMPVLPTLHNAPESQHAQTITQPHDIQMFSQRDPMLNVLSKVTDRPGSTILMQIGEKGTKSMIKKKFDIANARHRDPTKPMSHSYKSKLNNPVTTSQKWKDSKTGANTSKNSMGMGQRIPQQPVIVQYQNALARENKNVSPFMVTGPDLDPEMATI